jgi:hypothetical protein
MTRPALASVVLAVVTVFVAASPAVAKFPPGTAFEACGASGCRTATGEEALEVSLSLLEPTIEHGDAGAPSGAAAWIRVDISFPDRGRPGSPRWLRSIERRFPVIFVPDAESLGVPRGGDTYRWVSLRSPPARARSYTQVAEGVQPFAAQALAVLDPIAVARADPDGASGSAGDGGEAMPALLIVGAAIALLLAGGLAYRGTHLGRREA